jgi:hypothetical protein
MRQKDKVVHGRKGAEIMSSWIIIIFAYVVIAMALFSMVEGSGFHPLFLD